MQVPWNKASFCPSPPQERGWVSVESQGHHRLESPLMYRSISFSSILISNDEHALGHVSDGSRNTTPPAFRVAIIPNHQGPMQSLAHVPGTRPRPPRGQVRTLPPNHPGSCDLGAWASGENTNQDREGFLVHRGASPAGKDAWAPPP